MLNEVFGRVPCNSSFKKDEVVYVNSMIQQMNEKLAPFKWYNHAPKHQSKNITPDLVSMASPVNVL